MIVIIRDHHRSFILVHRPGHEFSDELKKLDEQKKRGKPATREKLEIHALYQFNIICNECRQTPIFIDSRPC